jgi:hypothetical protein
MVKGDEGDTVLDNVALDGPPYALLTRALPTWSVGSWTATPLAPLGPGQDRYQMNKDAKRVITVRASTWICWETIR